MSGKTIVEFPFGNLYSPWETVEEISRIIPIESWVLVGGLMVQTHALIGGSSVRPTKDADLVIDVFSDTANIERVVFGLKEAGFELKIPGLRFAPFHRLIRDEQVVDVLVADHLPSRKRARAKIGALTMMEVEGGAQALDRKMLVEYVAGESVFQAFVPDLLGALVMKGAAYRSDNRESYRHIDDAAQLACLIDDVEFERSRLRGSDRTRLQSICSDLADPAHEAWDGYPENMRNKGRESLRILMS